MLVQNAILPRTQPKAPIRASKQAYLLSETPKREKASATELAAASLQRARSRRHEDLDALGDG
jgi:hypothetical protein